MAVVSDSNKKQPKLKTPFKIVSLKQEKLERKLALTFGFMSFIPILILTWALVFDVDLSIAIYPVVISSFIGYFFIARPMVQSVIMITKKISAAAAGNAERLIDIDEQNEIGELARSFNRITHELEGKIDELESSRQLAKKLLARIGTAINSYDGIDNLLNLIVENSASALGAEMGSLMLVDGEKKDLYVKTSWSNNGQIANNQFRVTIGEGIIGSVVKEGQPIRARGKASILGFSNTRENETAILCVPLKLRDNAIGVIIVLRDDPEGSFTDDDESLLMSIGSQVAIAIENYRLNLNIDHTYLETIMALALAVEAKDSYSAGHSKRVGYYSARIAEEMNCDEEMQRIVNDGGILHDIGKIGIKDEILLKPGPLTPDEFKIMQQHSVIGEAIVKPVRSLSNVVQLVRHHHERYDGGGYPSGLKGEEIPLGARILAVADSYDAMVTDRPYRKRLTLEQAIAELKRCSGSQHDPKPVEALLRILARKEQTFIASTKAPAASR